MSLPDVVRSHHTAWVSVAGNDRRSVLVRYAVWRESLVMFGDEELSGVADGARVTVTVHEIHDGPPLVTFGATLRVVEPSEVDREALAELLAHVSLGHGLVEISAHLDDICAHRRVVALAS